MHMLVKVKFSQAEFNQAVRDGGVGQKIRRILEDLKPEAVYYTNEDGEREVILIIDLLDPTKIPALKEPWLLTSNSEVGFQVVMTPEDQRKAGLEELGQKRS